MIVALALLLMIKPRWAHPFGDRSPHTHANGDHCYSGPSERRNGTSGSLIGASGASICSRSQPESGLARGFGLLRVNRWVGDRVEHVEPARVLGTGAFEDHPHLVGHRLALERHFH